MEIGDRLKQGRNEQKLTQENLAEQLGLVGRLFQTGRITVHIRILSIL